MVYNYNTKLLQQFEFTRQLLFVVFTVIIIICFGEIDWLMIEVNILGLMMQQIS
jgi:hypothetical protein